MIHNDVLRRLRYALDYYDSTLVEIFALGGHTLTADDVNDFFRKEDDPAYQECGHPEMECFLNGLIIYRRGLKEGAPAPVKNPEAILINNDVLKKLRIALELHELDLLAIMKQAGNEISKHEMSALFRKDGHKHYKECGDQFMRHFLRGLTAWCRAIPPPATPVEPAAAAPTETP